MIDRAIGDIGDRRIRTDQPKWVVFPIVCHREFLRATQIPLWGSQVLHHGRSEEPVTTDDWENDPLWLIGTDPVMADVTDASVNHDLYLYGPLSEAARAEIKE